MNLVRVSQGRITYLVQWYCPPEVLEGLSVVLVYSSLWYGGLTGAMEAISASDSVTGNERIQIAMKSQMVPPKPPLIIEKFEEPRKATQVAITTLERPKIESERKLRLSS